MKRIIVMLLYSAVLFYVSSCVRDELPDIPTQDADTQVHLSLNLPMGSLSATRALDFTSENTIDNIYLLVFNQANNLVDIKPADNLTPAPGPDPNYAPGQQYSATYNFNVTLPPTMGANTSKLVVLANSARILTNTIGTSSSSSYIGRSYDDVIAAIYDNLAGQMYPDNTGRIPMWGETAQIQISPQNSNQTVDMVRAVARIDVGVGQATWNAASKSYTWNGNNAQGTAIPFRITSVTVVRANNRYSVVPATANHTGTTVNTPTIPSGTTAYSVADSKTNFTYNTTTGYVTYSIYTPEADIRMGANGVPGDANHQNRMAIVVGGNYNNSTTTTYYRLDFATNGNLINVLRNHIYQISIQGANGPGQSTVDDAYIYNAPPVTMTANILAWNQAAMNNVAFDGQNRLVTNKDQIALFSNQYTNALATGDNVVAVNTDVPAGWTVSSITNEAGDGTPIWISVNPTQGSANTTTNMTISVTQNTTGSDRTAIINLAAGRLRLPIRVTQITQPALSLNIVNSGGQEIQELVFASSGGTAPASQSFTVNWLPASNPVRVAASQVARYEFPNPGGNPASDDGAPYTNMPWPETTGTKNFTVSPPAMSASDLANDPFMERASRFDMSVNNGQTTMTKSITLRQLQYSLRVEQSPSATQTSNPGNALQGPIYASLGGRQYTYNVRSNSTWRISAISETRQIDGSVSLLAPRANGDNVYVGATGQANTTPGGGIRELFTTNNTRRGNSGFIDVTYSSDPSGRFTDVTQRIYIPSAPFVVYGITGMGGSTASTYNIYSGNATSNTQWHLQTMVNYNANFGTNINGLSRYPLSTVFVSPVTVTGYNNNSSSAINSSHITAATNAGADMLIISGSTTFDSDAANAIYTQFLGRDKPVLLLNEDANSMAALFIAIRNAGKLSSSSDNMSWSTTGLNGSAPVYQFNSVTDPLISDGKFRNLNSAYWGCDGNGSIAYWFTNSSGTIDNSNIVQYSNARNQSGNTDNLPSGLPSGATMDNGSTSFRFRNVPLVFAADGGFMGTFDPSQTTSSPSYIGSEGLPTTKAGYGGGSTKRDVSNSLFIANVIAWSIQRRTTQ